MKQKTKGSGLVFAVILMFVILTMVVTLSSITLLETKMGQKTKSSVGAFYSSESGVEWALNLIASKSGTIGNVLSGYTVGSDGKIDCPFTGKPCSVYFLDSAGKVISQADFGQDISVVKAVRSVGTSSTGDTTQRAIEAAVAVENTLQCKRVISNDEVVTVSTSPLVLTNRKKVFGSLSADLWSAGKYRTGQSVCDEVWSGSICMTGGDPIDGGNSTIQCDGITIDDYVASSQDDFVVCCKVELR